VTEGISKFKSASDFLRGGFWLAKQELKCLTRVAVPQILPLSVHFLQQAIRP